MSLEDSFILPGTDLEVPLYSESGELISIGFLEVGCRTKGKDAQLQGDRELFHKFWGDNYFEDIGERPKVYRILAHYCPNNTSRVGARIYGSDLALKYFSISDEQLDNFSEDDWDDLYFEVANCREGTQKLKALRERHSALEFHKILTSPGSPDSINNLRGKVAEIFTQIDIEENAPEGMTILRNGFLEYFNRKYHWGTEIDAILFFHGRKPILDLTKSLRSLDHLKVSDTFHNSPAQLNL